MSSDRLDHLLACLEGKLDAAGILIGNEISKGYASDAVASGEMPLAVLRPRDTQEVSTILSAANALGQPIVVQGGRTGLSGASRPRANEVSLSLERMIGVESVVRASQTMTVAAGTPLQVVQDTAENADFFFGVDIGSRGTATVGGNISTNAGGIRVLRYGMYRSQVMGVEAVLADGTILSSLKGLAKDNSGYDLNPLFIGTEGTIGVVTRACLKLYPKPKLTRIAFVALHSLAAAITLLTTLRVELSGLLSAFEIIFPNVYESTVAHINIHPPLKIGAGMYAMVEIHGQSPDIDSERFETVLANTLENGTVIDVVLSSSMRELYELWKIRDGINEYLFANGITLGFDVSVPVIRMQEFLDRSALAIREIDPDARAYIFGHLGDGNLHYCMFTHEVQKVSEAIFREVAAVSGGVTAEHGIGTDKVAYLRYVRSDSEIATMRRLKKAFDPNFILNRGRVFDPLI